MSAVRDHIARGENRKRGGIYLIFQDICIFNNVFLFQRPFRMIFVKNDNKKRIVQIDIQICATHPKLLPYFRSFIFPKTLPFFSWIRCSPQIFFYCFNFKRNTDQTLLCCVDPPRFKLQVGLFKRYCVCVF